MDYGKWGEITNSGKPEDVFLVYLLREWSGALNEEMATIIKNKANELFSPERGQ